MINKLFSKRQGDGVPSTQFAATIVAMPDVDTSGPVPLADQPNPDTLAPDTLAPDSLASDSLAIHSPPSHGLAADRFAFDSSGGEGAMPDVVTDIGGLPSEVPDPADAPTLSHIGRYALKRQLGAGGLGAVFEAWDPLLSRAVAVKTLQFDVDPEARTSLDGLFLNEARAAAGLNHRYIVTIHDAGLSAHGVYIAMERLYGRDLHRALAEGWRPTVEQTMTLVRRVTEALAYAHARGVVHCDIKPANIFLQRREKPKVLDFGIARIVHGRKLPVLEGAVTGSPRYRAPEQLSGGAVDARTDLYALGVVMYELLTGHRAFEGDSLDDINQAVLDGKAVPVHERTPDVPHEVSAIVSRLMARAPADRYTCASELSADLRRWLVARQVQLAHQAQQAPLTNGSPGASPDHALPTSSMAALRGPLAAATNPPADAGARSTRWLLLAGALLAASALVLASWRPWHTPSARELSARELPARTTGGTPAAPATASPPLGEPVAGSATGSGGTDGAAALGADAGRPTHAPAVQPAALVDGNARPSPATSSATAAPALTKVAPSNVSADKAGTRSRGDANATRLRPVAGVDTRTRDTRVDEDTRAAAPAATGVVQLAVSPWGQVEVNGTAMGTTPPLARLTLPAGSHTITLRNADFAPHTVQVLVDADKPVTLRHRFGT